MNGEIMARPQENKSDNYVNFYASLGGSLKKVENCCPHAAGKPSFFKQTPLNITNTPSNQNINPMSKK